MQWRGALELAVQSLPDVAPDGRMDVFAVALPVLAFDGGPEVGLELGAPLRLRLLDGAPLQRGDDVGGWLRREDWDERSDFGQLLRSLRVGTDDAALALRAGPLLLETLGHGGLVSRYTNRLLADHHPAGATLRVFAGPTRTEVLASDVLGLRLFAADVAVDAGALLGLGEAQAGRYHVSFSAAHDAGRTAGGSPELTLLHADVDAALHRGERLHVVAFGGLGSRLLPPQPALGGQLGLEVEALLPTAVLGGRVAARRVGGGFREGMFGADYELARFVGSGLRGVPLAEERLPEGFSGYALVQLGLGAQDVEALRRSSRVPRALVSAAVEHFSFGRTDVDALVQVELPGARGSAAARFVATGLGQAPRFAGSLEARVRLVPSLYLLASGGTAFFPQADGRLLRGVTASVGAGADFAL
ncbi:MAG: hypothetical protein L0Y66_22200 [Myxococcaceae bacterium]|nr:hypothetical protein [Myxococcaceae bacterium]MCI0669313.1 hypothetical protein [Myxococcaceae bacterium]